jgi:hypothetical protein
LDKSSKEILPSLRFSWDDRSVIQPAIYSVRSSKNVRDAKIRARLPAVENAAASRTKVKGAASRHTSCCRPKCLRFSMFREAATRKTAYRMSLAEKSPSGTWCALSLESSVNSLKTCCISSWCLPRRLDLRLESGTFQPRTRAGPDS